MQLYKIHTFFVVASSLEQAKEAVKNKLPATYFSESICPVDIVAVEQSRALDFAPRCPKCNSVAGWHHEACEDYSPEPQSQ